MALQIKVERLPTPDCTPSAMKASAAGATASAANAGYLPQLVAKAGISQPAAANKAEKPAAALLPVRVQAHAAVAAGAITRNSCPSSVIAVSGGIFEASTSQAA